MQAIGFDEDDKRLLVNLTGDDAGDLALALRSACAVVDASDLSVIVGLRKEHVDASVERLEKVQPTVDDARGDRPHQL